MASKSKKRRRVLGASCILAALIIAGSSFAWFTSKDEVTNRLTANADYGVRIVESFAPPANWLPGQEVDKDVYAVNTGNIGAFVKETVTSKVTITREKRVTDFPVRDTSVYEQGDPLPTGSNVGDPKQALADYRGLVDDWFEENKDDLVKLTPAERYSVEAGSYLALMPEMTNAEKTASRNNVGRQIVSFVDIDPSTDPYNKNDDVYKADTVVTDFAPDFEGIYVFRRIIGVNEGDAQNYGPDSFKYTTEEFEYDAYYYKDGEYYKVELTSITGDGIRDLADDGKDTDGLLSSATFRFFKEETTVETPTLAYDAKNHELIATIGGYSESVSTLAAEAAAVDTKEMAYENALLKLYEKVESYKGLEDTERTKLLDYIQAQIDEANAKEAYLNEKANYDNLTAQYTTIEGKYDAKHDTDLVNASKKLYGDTKKYYPAVVNSDYTPDTAYATDGQEPAYSAITDFSALGSGSYSNYMNAKKTYDDMAEHTAEEAFLAQLRTFATSKTQADGTTPVDVSASSTIESIAAQLKPEDLHTFVEQVKTTNPEWANLADLAEKKKTYDDDVAAYKAISNQVKALKDQMDAVENGRKASWNNLYGKAEPATVSDRTHPNISAYDTATSAISTTSDTNHNGANGLYQKYVDKVNERISKKTAYDTAKTNAQGPNGSPDASGKAEYANALADVVTAKNELDDARLKYELTKTDFDRNGDIIIHIGLGNEVVAGGEYASSAFVADKWQLLPATTLTDTLPNNEAVFYYTSILDGGHTSSKLINYVKLDDSVTQYMFKSFDFDLDVAMDSVQIAKDSNDDNKLVATPANAHFAATETRDGATVTISDPLSDDPILMWTGTSATATNTTKFAAKVTGGNDVEIAYDATGKTIDGVTYNYKITSGSDDYYGNSINAGTEYKKVNGAAWATGADAATLTLTTDGVVKE